MKLRAPVPEGIKSPCLTYFLTKETFNFIMNIAAPVVIMFIGAVMTYALVNAGDVTALKKETVELRTEVNTLQNQINVKLDTLLARR